MATPVVVRLPRCIRCQSTDHRIEGDGAVVCSPCVLLLGAIAGNPTRADDHILAALLERHGEVVDLVGGRGERGSMTLRWEWTQMWPGRAS